MRIVLVGAVESTAVTFCSLRDHGALPVAVFGLAPELSHRHSDFVDMLTLATASNVPFTPVRSINEPAVVAAIKELRPDWLVVVGWSQICGESLIALPRLGSIGYHPSPLPRLRGRAVLAWTILLGLRSTAGTLFRLAPGVDSGPILAQADFEVDERETLHSLMAKHMDALKDMWAAAVPHLKDNSFEEIAQDESQASYCAKRIAQDGLIDWREESASVDRLVRAVTRPYPGAFGWLDGAKFTIWKAEIWTGPTYFSTPGQIVASSREGLLISCGGNTALLVQDWEWHGDSGSPPKVGGRILSSRDADMSRSLAARP